MNDNRDDTTPAHAESVHRDGELYVLCSDDTTPPHASTLPALWEPYPIATLDMPPTREVSSAQQIDILREKVVKLVELRRADLEAMEAAQALLLPTNAGMIRSAFDMLESRTGWMQRVRQSVACEGPLEGDDAC